MKPCAVLFEYEGGSLEQQKRKQGPGGLIETSLLVPGTHVLVVLFLSTPGDDHIDRTDCHF
jgi:hypothetical protein